MDRLKGMTEISVVIPAHNEEKNIASTFREIQSALENSTAEWEIIFVDDGSRDRSAIVLRDLAAKTPWLKPRYLMRNYGQTAALQAGFDAVQGRYTVTLDGEDVLAMSVDERARAGIFLGMQYPVEVPGVSVSNFLRTAKTAIEGEAPKLRTWVKDVKDAMAGLRMDPEFANRNVNEGFSGGEKKRHEILQMELLKPKFAVLDETDSGLDVDALRIVSEGVNRAKASTDVGILLITHYTRILRYITPDFVHVFVDGRIAEEGGPELADHLEAEGYDRFLTNA